MTKHKKTQTLDERLNQIYVLMCSNKQNRTVREISNVNKVLAGVWTSNAGEVFCHRYGTRRHDGGHCAILQFKSEDAFACREGVTSVVHHTDKQAGPK